MSAPLSLREASALRHLEQAATYTAQVLARLRSDTPEPRRGNLNRDDIQKAVSALFEAHRLLPLTQTAQPVEAAPCLTP